MPIPNPADVLVVGVSSSALFDTRTEEALVREDDISEFLTHREKFEDQPLGKGTAFPVIEGLLRLNTLGDKKRLVEVVIVSKNDPSACFRVTNSLEHHGLDISCFAFTSGDSVIEYLKAYGVTLFLSRSQEDVDAALASGIGAARVYDPPANIVCSVDQLRIAFDGDAVLFSDEAEKVYQQAKRSTPDRALAVFHAHEKAKALIPLPPGPLAPFFRVLAELQRHTSVVCRGQLPAIRTALITARNLPAHKRALKTLQTWGVTVDVAVFLGGKDKARFVRAFNPQIFFDDQDRYVAPAAVLVPSAIVPCETTAVGQTRVYPERADVSTGAEVRVAADRIPVAAPDRSPDHVSVTKAEFVKRCRAVFASYVPMNDGHRKLEKKHRDFVAAGVSQIGVERARIVADLERYSLSSLKGHDPMLNREGAALERKLDAILRGAARQVVGQGVLDLRIE
jgi:5'-nucleotidase